MRDFFQHAIHTPAPRDAGTFTGGGAKIIHHSTEGSTFAGAMAAFRQGGDSFPHFTDTFENGVYRVHQHIPLSHAARALEHPPGTPETNRDRCIQIEHVGFAAHMHEIPEGYIAGIARLCRFIENQVGVARVAPFAFTPPGVAHRLGADTFHHFSGHLGHQHVPNQPAGHSDPGRLPIASILAHEGHFAHPHTKAA
jgi:hypothetical protein